MRRIIIFRLVSVIVVPGIFFLAAELLLRVLPLDFEAYESYEAVKTDREASFITSIDGQEHFQLDDYYFRSARGEIVTVEKPTDTLRIVSVGGSASNGLPHTEGYSYLRELEALFHLNALLPKKVEFLNLGANGFASYRVKQVFKELHKLSPDLIVIYSGNNEFVENRQYAFSSALAQRLYRFAMRLKVGQAIASVLKQDRTVVIPEKVRFDVYKNTAMGKASALRASRQQTQMVLDDYHENIEAMLKQAQAEGVPVVLMTTPNNLLEWRPHVSVLQANGTARIEWLKEFTKVRKLLSIGDHERAVGILRDLIKVEPDHAESHYLLGVALAKLGNTDEAYTELWMAKELDYGPFRALTALNDSLRELGEKYEHAAVVDLVNEFKMRAVGVAPGFDLFHDYCHPTIRGDRIIANALFDTIVDSGLLQSATSSLKKSNLRYLNIDARNEEIQVSRMMVIKWSLYLHQHQHTVFLAEQLIADSSGELDPKRLQEAQALRAIVLDYITFKNGDYSVKPWADPEELREFPAHQRFKRLYWGLLEVTLEDRVY